ncbi:MAG: outer membrane protein assembly factor BamD [Planctomycetes bacterium]|nr:outer membrane protein assembly factor BamD [Planctomycetota bacterium]
MKMKAVRGLAALTIAAVAIALVQAQDEQYRERQVLDPDSNEWIAQAGPVEDTPEGGIDLARSYLAQNKPRSARRILKKWLKKNPDHERLVEGHLLLGEAEFLRGDYFKAYERYEYVVENSGGELFHRALRREMDVARAFLSGQKRIVWKFLRMPAYDDGIEALSRVWERIPGTRMGEQALRLIADYYFAVGDFDLAQDEYARLVREYPSGRFTSQAMLRSAEAAEAAFPGIKFDDRALLEAEERYRQFRAAYPGRARDEDVESRLLNISLRRAAKDLDIAQWYETARRPGAAAYYYQMILRDWPDSLEATTARQRLEALGVDITGDAEGTQ